MFHSILTTPSPCRAGASRSTPCSQELIALLPDEAHQDPLLGRCILKNFDGQDYFGHVVGIDADPVTGERFYHVTYEDGDEEHLVAAEVVKLSGGQIAAPPPSGRPSFSYSRAATPRLSYALPNPPPPSCRSSSALSHVATPRPSCAWQASGSTGQYSYSVSFGSLQNSHAVVNNERCWILMVVLCGLLMMFWLIPDGLTITSRKDDTQLSQLDASLLESSAPFEETFFANAVKFNEKEIPTSIDLDVDLPDLGLAFPRDMHMLAGSILRDRDAVEIQSSEFFLNENEVAEIKASASKEHEQWLRQAQSHEPMVDIRESYDIGEQDALTMNWKLRSDDVERWAENARAEFDSTMDVFFSTYGDDTVILITAVSMLLVGVILFARSIVVRVSSCPPTIGNDSPISIRQDQEMVGPDISAIASASPVASIVSPVIASPPAELTQLAVIPGGMLASSQKQRDAEMTPMQPCRSSTLHHEDVPMSPIPVFSLPAMTPRHSNSEELNAPPVSLGFFYVVQPQGYPGDHMVAKVTALNAERDEVTLQICEPNLKRFRLTPQTMQVSRRDLLHGPFRLTGGYVPRHISQLCGEALPTGRKADHLQPVAKARLRNTYFEMPQQRFRFTASLNKMTDMGFVDTPELREVLMQCAGNVNDALRQYWSDN